MTYAASCCSLTSLVPLLLFTPCWYQFPSGWWCLGTTLTNNLWPEIKINNLNANLRWDKTISSIWKLKDSHHTWFGSSTWSCISCLGEAVSCLLKSTSKLHAHNLEKFKRRKKNYWSNEFTVTVRSANLNKPVKAHYSI